MVSELNNIKIATKKSKPLLDMLVVRKQNKIYQFHSFILTNVCICSSLVYANFAAFRYDTELNGDETSGLVEHQPFHYDDEKLIFWKNFAFGVEMYMLLDFLLQFCLEYPTESLNHVYQLKETAIHYAYGEMIYDLLPLIPFHLIFKFKYSRLLFVIKNIRIKKSFILLDTRRFRHMKGVYFKSRLDKFCTQEEIAENQDDDYNEIMA
jgi:hypothetical protein